MKLYEELIKKIDVDNIPEVDIENFLKRIAVINKSRSKDAKQLSEIIYALYIFHITEGGIKLKRPSSSDVKLSIAKLDQTFLFIIETLLNSLEN